MTDQVTMTTAIKKSTDLPLPVGAHKRCDEQCVPILEKAATLIETVGHVKGVEREYDNTGNVSGYCATGAIYYASYGVNGWPALYGDLLIHVQDALDESGRSFANIVEWNDNDETTREEVVELLRATAKELTTKVADYDRI